MTGIVDTGTIARAICARSGTAARLARVARNSARTPGATSSNCASAAQSVPFTSCLAMRSRGSRPVGGGVTSPEPKTA